MKQRAGGGGGGGGDEWKGEKKKNQRRKKHIEMTRMKHVRCDAAIQLGISALFTKMEGYRTCFFAIWALGSRLLGW